MLTRVLVDGECPLVLFKQFLLLRILICGFELIGDLFVKRRNIEVTGLSSVNKSRRIGIFSDSEFIDRLGEQGHFIIVVQHVYFDVTRGN